MNTGSADYDEQLKYRTEEVLHYLWDPVAVAHVPHARGAYSALVAEVVGLLKADAPATEIAAYLDAAATTRTALQADTRKSLLVAKVLIRWHADDRRYAC